MEPYQEKQRVAEVVLDRNGRESTYLVKYSSAEAMNRGLINHVGETYKVIPVGKCLANETYRKVGNDKTQKRIEQMCTWGEYEAVELPLWKLPQQLREDLKIPTMSELETGLQRMRDIYNL